MEEDGSQNTDMELLRALYVKVEPDRDFIRSLVRKTDNLNITDEDGTSALHIAAELNFVNSALILLDAGAQVNTRRKGDESPLHICSCLKHGTEMVRLLLKYGADVNAVDWEKETPLHNASRYHCLENVQELLKNGANVDAANDCGDTPLYSMLKRKNPEISIMQALLKAGADANRRDSIGGTYLHTLCYIEQSKGVQVIRLLLAYKADVNARDDRGDTPLHIRASIKNNMVEMVQELIKAGSIVNALNSMGRSPLYYAVRSVNVEVTRELLRSGATVSLLKCLNAVSMDDDDDFKASIEICKDLIRYAFIRSPDSVDVVRQELMKKRVAYYLRKWSSPDVNLENFRDGCLAEVDVMCAINCHCGKSSVWRSLNSCPECICDTDHAIVKFLVSGRPSHFSDAFFYKLTKEFLLEIVLHQISFFEFKKSKKCLMLDWSCVKEIDSYVSFEDLVLFLQRKESAMVTSEVDKFFAFMKGEIPDESSSKITSPSPKTLCMS